jgi:hypothetical protein
MASSSEDEGGNGYNSDLEEEQGGEEAVYSSSDESNIMERKKRTVVSIRLRGTRKKSRSMDENDAAEAPHTGLSPRMNRMDIVSHQQNNFESQNSGVFFLDDGVETFSVDGDPRIAGVRDIYSELDSRLERAAVSAGLTLNDPAVSNYKKQLALRAAELESSLADRFGGPGTRSYRDAIYRVVCWIHAATDAELRDVLEGRLNNLYLEDVKPVSYQQQDYHTTFRGQ